MVSERIQWIIVILLGLLLLLVGVVCYKKDKDNYFYDFATTEGSLPEPNPYFHKYFEDTKADVEHSITNRRSLVSCDLCRDLKETPSACEACHLYVKGQEYVKEGVM